MKKNLLSIGGFDPSAGAGVLLDTAVFHSLGFRGHAILTALTAQNSRKVRKVLPLPAAFLELQYRILAEEFRPEGIKAGMIASAENLEVVTEIFARNKDIPRVVDPVFRSSSGARLLEKKGVQHYLRALGGKVSLITPNLEEAAVLTGRPVRTLADMRLAASGIHDKSGIPCLVKGGHLKGRTVDVLFDGRLIHDFPHKRIRKDIHGTGCFLASAILAFLAKGYGLVDGCRQGIAITHRSMGRAVRLGRERWVFSPPYGD